MMMNRKQGAVSNVTNQMDPRSVNSRAFVGNLNTLVVKKEDVEKLFKRYGRIAGISMHKGYAFVQYHTEMEARRAVMGEEGRMVAGQPLDVNLASEPKPRQLARKRMIPPANGAGADWDFFYESYAPPMRPMPPPPPVPPLKRPRLDPVRQLMQMSGPPHAMVRPKGKAGQPATKTQLKTLNLHNYGIPDILICGNCKNLFDSLESLTDHKKQPCKLRFQCKCNGTSSESAAKASDEPDSLKCVACDSTFATSWDMLKHAQNEHSIPLYDSVLTKENAAKPVNGDNDLILNGDSTGCGDEEDFTQDPEIGNGDNTAMTT